MTEPETVLELTLHVGSDPISGTLKDEAGAAPVRFHGWMELARLLERAHQHEPLVSREPA